MMLIQLIYVRRFFVLEVDFDEVLLVSNWHDLGKFN